MPIEPKLEAIVDKVFAQGGLLSELFEMEYREQQHLYATDVCQWLKERSGSVAMLEGETGIGKSLAYLLPLAIHISLTGKRALISTYTVHLIHQLNDDKQVIKTVLDRLNLRPVSIANRLGRAQYISASRLLSLADDTEHQATKKQLLSLHKKIQKHYGPHVYVKYLSENAANFDLQSVESIALTEHCSENDAQWYDQDCKASGIADIVLTSHTCSMLYARGVNILNNEKPFSILIADEADRLPEAAESIMRIRTSPRRISAIIEDLQGQVGWKKSDTRRVCTALNQLQQVVDDCGNSFTDKTCILSKELMPGQNARYIEAVKESSQLVQSLLKSLSNSMSESIAAKISSVRAFENSLARVIDDKSQSICIAWSPVNRIGSIAIDDPFAGLSFSRLVRGIDEKQPPISVMLTSGTLGQSDKSGLSRYTPIRSTLGIRESDVKVWGHYSPKKYGKITFILAGKEVPKPFHSNETQIEAGTYNPVWLQYAADMLSECIRSGKTLCLCPSFIEVEELQHVLSDQQKNIGWHVKGTKLDNLITMLQSGEIEAIVTPSAWEGVSIRGKRGGQLLRNVMMTRIPIQPPNDVTESTFIAHYQENDRSKDDAVKHLYSRIRDRALRKLQQGLIGRGIRANNDVITAWVADPRIGPDRQHRLAGVIPDRFSEAYNNARYFLNADQEINRPEENISNEIVAWL